MEAYVDFTYVITFEFMGRVVSRSGKGLFYPHDGGFNLEHMLWLMTEEFGRPDHINVDLDFLGVPNSPPLLLGKG